MGRPKGIPSAKTNCPHCGKELSTIRIWTHERICIRNPAVRPLIVAAMTGRQPGEGVTMSQYSVISSNDTRIPDVTTLRRATGARDWAGVLAEFGLVTRTVVAITETDKPRTAAQIAEDAEAADVARMTDETRRLLAADFDAAHTFNGYKARDLPGVYVNGKPCQVITLR